MLTSESMESQEVLATERECTSHVHKNYKALVMENNFSCEVLLAVDCVVRATAILCGVELRVNSLKKLFVPNFGKNRKNSCARKLAKILVNK